jgi:predicted Zn-dependent protease
MRDILLEAVDRMLSQGADFCDARFQDLGILSIKVVDGGVRSIVDDSMAGVCFRSRIGGSWGYASTVDLDKTSLLSVCQESIKNARKGTSEGENLTDEGFDTGTYDAGVRIHPDDICMEEKLSDLMELDSAQRCDPRVVNSNSEYNQKMGRTTLINSLGADLE